MGWRSEDGGDGTNVEELRYTNNFWRVSASKRAEKAPALVPEQADRRQVGTFLSICRRCYGAHQIRTTWEAKETGAVVAVSL